MRRLIMALVVAGVLFGTVWILHAGLPLTGGAAQSDTTNGGDSWGGIGLMGAP